LTSVTVRAPAGSDWPLALRSCHWRRGAGRQQRVVQHRPETDRHGQQGGIERTVEPRGQLWIAWPPLFGGRSAVKPGHKPPFAQKA
jgi:hypothetical protein